MLVITMMVITLPMFSSAQDWAARNIYTLNISPGVGIGVDYNETGNVLKVLLNADYARLKVTTNVGLAILEVVFGNESVPNKIDAYLLIDDKTVEYQNQLINWSITNTTWTFFNGSTIKAFYVYAYIYMFANQSITDETYQRPYFEQRLTPMAFNDEKSTQVVTESGSPVYVDYVFDETTVNPPVMILDLSGVVLFGVGVIVGVIVIWTFKKKVM